MAPLLLLYCSSIAPLLLLYCPSLICACGTHSRLVLIVTSLIQAACLKQLVGHNKPDANLQTLSVCFVVGGGYPPASTPEMRPIPDAPDVLRVLMGLRALALANGVVLNPLFFVDTISIAIKKAILKGMLVNILIDIAVFLMPPANSDPRHSARAGRRKWDSYGGLRLARTSS
jgi:hypothetical protein